MNVASRHKSGSTRLPGGRLVERSTGHLHAEDELKGVGRLVFEHEAWCCVGDTETAA